MYNYMKNVVGCLLLLCLLQSSFSYAQQFSVSGTVKDSVGKTLQDATVSIFKEKDSLPLKSARTSPAGQFSFSSLAPGPYLLKVSMVGYLAHSATILVQSDSRVYDVQLGLANDINLAGVTVTARKPFLEKKVDRTVVNVDAMIGSTGSDVWQLLENVPGLLVDDEGNISLNGRPGVTVMINDKPTYLSGTALVNYLKSLPSSSLNEIELIPNPPAKYDAAGNAGLINIKTKKLTKGGYNGSIASAITQGKLFNTNNSLNLNYRSGKVNIFGTASYLLQNNYTDLDINRTYFNNSGQFTHQFLQNSYIRRHNESFSGRGGIDYSVDKNTSIGMIASILRRPSSQKTANTSRIVQISGQLDSATLANNSEERNWENESVNFNIKRDFAGAANSIQADVDYIVYRSGNDQFFDNTTIKTGSADPVIEQLRGDLPSSIKILASKVDYVFPIRKINFETGVKSSYTSTDNIASYFILENGGARPDYEKTNNFKYKENIYAGYFSLQANPGRFSVKAGLRGEHTVVRGHQLGNAMKKDSSFAYNYTSLFPTAFVSYKLDSSGSTQLTFSYGRRIERPAYQDLNPYISPLDKFSLYVGNPFLRPSYTHDLSLSYSITPSIVVTAIYNVTDDVSIEALTLNGNNYLSRPDNLGKNRIMGVWVNSSLKPAKWWTLNLYAEVQDRHYEGKLFTRYMDTSGIYVGGNLTNQFQFGKGWTAELTGSARSSILVGQVSLGALWLLNAGIQKKVLKNKGSIRLAVRDIFFSSIRNGEIHNLPGAIATFRNKSDLRTFTLGLSYNFGKASQESRTRRNGSAEAEQERVRS